MSNSVTKEQLLQQYKELRMYYFNVFEEDKIKFEKRYKNHPLYSLVLKHLDKNFTEVNQIAQLEIDNYLNNDH